MYYSHNWLNENSLRNEVTSFIKSKKDYDKYIDKCIEKCVEIGNEVIDFGEFINRL